MKKRILSMLLLVTLLVTGIPVMAISAEETPVYTNEDYAELYAKQGNLVHLYMAFNNGDAAEYYDLSARKWYDLVGGGMGEIDAMLKHDTTANWTVGANGGFTISMPDKTRSATNKITFGTGAAGTAADALKDASGKFFTKYTVESAIKIVNRQIDFRYDTFDAAALAAKAVTASGVITYTIEGLGKVTSAHSLVNATTLTFTRSGDTSAAKNYTITYNNNGAATTTASVSFKAGAATASVDVSMVQSETATIKVNEADGLTLTGFKRVNGDTDIGAQVQNGYAFGNMFVLRWMNMKGFNPLTNSWANGRGLTRFCAGENYNATYVPAGTNFALVGKLSDPCMVLNDSSAVSLSLVKTVNAAGDKDVWSIYSGAITVGENVEALGLTGAETYGGKASSPDLFLMNKEQGTIYAVRIYNVDLTQAEINWNHFVDILAYNGYDISGIASLSAAKKEAIASYYAGISIEEADLSRLEEAQAVVDEDYDALYIRTAASGAQLIGLFTAFRGEIETVTADVANNKWTNKVGADSTDDIFLKQNNNQHWHVSANGGLWANGICVSSWNRIGDFRMELPDDWAALPSFTVEGAQILNGVESEKNPFPSGVYHMRIDLLRFHHSAAVRHSDPLHGGGTWHGNTSNAWHDGGRDNTWRKMYDTNGKEGAGDTMWVSKTTAADGAVTYAYGHSYAGGQTLQAIAGATYSAEAYDASDSARDFYMYASMAVEVYAIRVYNGVLSASEKQYNHLIDLLGFYQVSIPEEITTQHLATLASAYANTTMVLDDNGSG
ncbi:MAG: hypothetical protein J6W28_03975, partial [Clostridia bacterium]|nr:hypothetical protein [Clostridia bacterium]